MAKREDYKEIGDTFINPYNFVPIKEQTKRNINAEENTGKIHTGHLHCSLTVKTPMVIPDVENISEDGNGHKTYLAFRINNKLAIPGSSIRGMLRSVYEAATNSCMSTIDPKEHITKRLESKNAFDPCVLKLEKYKDKDGKEKDKWELYEAERIALVGGGSNYKFLQGEYKKFNVLLDGEKKYIEAAGKKLHFGDAVFIDPQGPEYKPGNKNCWDRSVKEIKTEKKEGTINGYLYLGEAFGKKHAESVFRIKEKKDYESMEIEKALKGLEETLKMYRSESVNRNLSSNIKPNEKHYGYRGYEDAKKNGVIPLWYKYDNGSLKLSLAAIGRITFDNDIEAISNNHSSCGSRRKICPACSVFGMVGTGDENNGLGSLIRVTDAIGIDEVKTTPGVTLKELGTPRTSYLKFYSEGGKGYDDKSALIRGRKFYWHIPAAANDNTIYTTKDKTKRNATFELINAGSRFEFDVYYDGLDENQLKMLLWTIRLPNNCEEGRSLMHKIGHGKPLGLGSVELKVEFNKERVYADDYEIKDSEVNVSYDNNPELLDSDSWKKLKMMLEYDPNSTDNISYPIIKLSDKAKDQKKNGELRDNDIASHQWFKWNQKPLPDDKKEKMYLIEFLGVEDKGKSPRKGNVDSNNTKNKNPKNLNDDYSKKTNGKIIFFNRDKGFGYIECKGKNDILLSEENFSGDTMLLKKGTEVEFGIVQMQNGKLKAKNCCLKKK